MAACKSPARLPNRVPIAATARPAMSATVPRQPE